VGEPLDSLRQLIAVAAAVGFDQVKLNEATDELVAMALRIAALERQADMRKTATADLADRVGRAHDAMERNGTSRRIPILCERFERSRGRIYQLLKLYRVTQHKSAV
jgi:hypothetical protein